MGRYHHGKQDTAEEMQHADTYRWPGWPESGSLVWRIVSGVS